MSVYWKPKIQADALVLTCDVGKVIFISCDYCKQQGKWCGRLKRYCPKNRLSGLDFGGYVTVAENDGWRFQIKNEGGSLKWQETKIAEENHCCKDNPKF